VIGALIKGIGSVVTAVGKAVSGLMAAAEEALKLPNCSVKGASTPCKDGATGTIIPKGCEYLNNPYTVEAPKAEFDRVRAPTKLGKGKPIKHKFPGDKKPSDALLHEVEVKGRKIKLIMPKDPKPPAGKHLPTAEQAAKGLGVVPGKQLDSFKQVQVSPQANPSDAYWAKEYKKPGFTSAATGGPSGVTFYPASSNNKQAFTDSTMIHEGGHAYSIALWKDAGKKTDWKKAITDDGRSPSRYADSSIGEDFSESLVMYSLSKGTKCEATAKKLYPKRYAKLEALFKK